MVAATFGSRAPPQVEQNRPFEETCAPQEEQYMGGEILPLREGALRTAAKAGSGFPVSEPDTANPTQTERSLTSIRFVTRVINDYGHR
jgi:hypothetical protein